MGLMPFYIPSHLHFQSIIYVIPVDQTYFICFLCSTWICPPRPSVYLLFERPLLKYISFCTSTPSMYILYPPWLIWVLTLWASHWGRGRQCPTTILLEIWVLSSPSMFSVLFSIINTQAVEKQVSDERQKCERLWSELYKHLKHPTILSTIKFKGGRDNPL